MRRDFEALHFEFVTAPPDEGRETIVGHWYGVDPSDVTITIVGPEENIVAIESMMAISGDSSEDAAVRMANGSMILEAAPDWGERQDWFKKQIILLAGNGGGTTSYQIDDHREASLVIMNFGDAAIVTLSITYQ